MTLKEQVDSENLRKIKVKDSLTYLEPTALIELFELYFNPNTDPFRFHAGTNNLKEIIWNGNKYYPIAIDTDGFESNMTGKLPRPKISIVNTENIFSSLLKDFSDLRDSKITRRKVLVRHLDAENFDSSINPFNSSDSSIYISLETFLISQKVIENKHFIQFELISPFDLQSLDSMNRSILGRYCFWQYRGLGCGYSGDLICQENDESFGVSSIQHLKNVDGINFKTKNNTVVSTLKEAADTFKWTEGVSYSLGNIVCVENFDLNGVKDPQFLWFVCIKAHVSSYFLQPNVNSDYWIKDACSKTINACKKRFSNSFNTDSNGYVFINDSNVTNNTLRFGGFPGTEKFKYE
jgi:lambda family phage minor tail protein L